MKKKNSILLWVFSIIFTIGIAYWQRTTGPTYPVRGNVKINNNEIKFKLPRTSDSQTGEEIKLKITDQTVIGKFEYKRYKSHDTLTSVDMLREGDYLKAIIPPQPAAGKVSYNIILSTNSETIKLEEESVVIRYKGYVPLSVLIPHIFFMFFAMLFSTRAGLEAIYKGASTYRFTFVTFVCFFIGGGILGPIVQKYAFDAYWTGWPFGHDLTDNKTLVALIFWAIAFFKLAKDKSNRKWVVIAAIVLLTVYLVPHSVLGSEIDYTQQQIK